MAASGLVDSAGLLKNTGFLKKEGRSATSRAGDGCLMLAIFEVKGKSKSIGDFTAGEVVLYPRGGLT